MNESLEENEVLEVANFRFLANFRFPCLVVFPSLHFRKVSLSDLTSVCDFRHVNFIGPHFCHVEEVHAVL